MTSMKIDFERERQWWDEKAEKEEIDIADEGVNRALRWREIERHLDGVRTILDIGGGTGAFSIRLARRGYSVTHLDFSPSMLSHAQANAAGVEGICFVEGNAIDLPFDDRSFDLVLNTDGAISFCGSEAERAIAESCRVASGRAVLAVSNRACMVPVWLQTGIDVLGQVDPATCDMLEKGEWHQKAHTSNVQMTKGLPQDYMGALKAFLPGELRGILERLGMKIVRLGSIGSLANLCGKECVDRVIADPSLFEEFVELCERYDLEIMPEGMGTRHRAGLIAVVGR